MFLFACIHGIGKKRFALPGCQLTFGEHGRIYWVYKESIIDCTSYDISCLGCAPGYYATVNETIYVNETSGNVTTMSVNVTINCTQCPVNSYKANLGNETICVSCPLNATTNNTGSIKCGMYNLTLQLCHVLDKRKLCWAINTSQNLSQSMVKD